MILLDSILQIGNQVRQSMIEIFVTYSSVKDYNAPILKQLSAAFTAQVARWPAVYNYVKTIDEIIANFPPCQYLFCPLYLRYRQIEVLRVCHQ